MLRGLAALALLGVAACADVVGPENIRPVPLRFAVPPHYADLWAQVEECSGRRGNMARIRWFYVPNTMQFEWEGDPVTGLWFSDHDIVLSEWSRTQNWIVRHEMLHDLVGGGGHPERYFQDLCGSLVSR